MNTAKELKKLTGFEGDARLFQVSPPMSYDYDYETEQNQKSTEYVVVSAVNAMFSGPETYIFPANEQGEIVNWGELDGSYKGGLNHRAALENAGYEVK